MRSWLVATLLASAACGGVHLDEARSSLSRIEDPMVAPADLASLVTGNNGFATSLYHALSAAPGNLVYSPYGISFNMAMLRENIAQSSKAALDAALGFSLPDPQLDPAFDALDLQLSAIPGKTASGDGQPFMSASAIWSAMAPTASYLDTLALYYGAGVLVGKDPGQAIADWQSTLPGDGPLPFALAGPCDEALVSYVHLDAAWQNSFDEGQTHAADFHRADGSVVQPQTMALTADLSIATTSPRAVELDYDGGGLSMLIIVPDDLAAFEATLGPDAVDEALSRMTVQHAALALPKLSYQVSASVLQAMQSIGLPLDAGHWQIWHSADIKLDEHGTIASAQTTTSHTPTSVQQSTPFAVDRPFVFFIRDRATGSLLFVGRVADPTAG